MVKLELNRNYQGHEAADFRFSNLVTGHFILLRFGTRLELDIKVPAHAEAFPR
jgi:hypothetical protein